MRVHCELQRLGEELQFGHRVAALLVPLVAGLREAGGGRPVWVVDVGCGLGYVVRWLAATAALGSGVELVGVDLNPVLVEEAGKLAGREGLRCSFIQENAFELGALVEDSGRTIVVSSGLMHHLPEPIPRRCLPLLRAPVRPAIRCACSKGRGGTLVRWMCCGRCWESEGDRRGGRGAAGPGVSRRHVFRLPLLGRTDRTGLASRRRPSGCPSRRRPDLRSARTGGRRGVRRCRAASRSAGFVYACGGGHAGCLRSVRACRPRCPGVLCGTRLAAAVPGLGGHPRPAHPAASCCGDPRRYPRRGSRPRPGRGRVRGPVGGRRPGRGTLR